MEQKRFEAIAQEQVDWFTKSIMGMMDEHAKSKHKDEPFEIGQLCMFIGFPCRDAEGKEDVAFVPLPPDMVNNLPKEHLRPYVLTMTTDLNPPKFGFKNRKDDTEYTTYGPVEMVMLWTGAKARAVARHRETGEPAPEQLEGTAWEENNVSHDIIMLYIEDRDGHMAMYCIKEGARNEDGSLVEMGAMSFGEVSLTNHGVMQNFFREDEEDAPVTPDVAN